MSEPIYGSTEFYHAIADAAAAERIGNRPSKRMVSEAMACHPSQVGEQMEEDRKRGLGTVVYDSEGRPDFGSDRDLRKRYMRAYGMYDRDAGYGDAAPNHHKGDKAPPSRLRELARRLAARIRVRHMDPVGQSSSVER